LRNVCIGEGDTIKKWLARQTDGAAVQLPPEPCGHPNTLARQQKMRSSLMNAYNYIIEKQIQWALNRGIELVGSEGERGRRAFTRELNQNLFRPLSPLVQEQIGKGDGNELKGEADNLPKMRAVHSSSALGVNVFQYWQDIGQVSVIAAACGFCQRGNDISEKIVFEDKYPISSAFRIPPNIDVVIHNKASSSVKCFAIECKFTEAYSLFKHGGLKKKYFNSKYLNQEIWSKIQNTHRLAESIHPDDNSFHYLHAAQLIKHILGLKSKVGKNGFKLLYLWYDTLGEAGSLHRKEIECFTKIAKADGINFLSRSYQELISILSSRFRDEHPDYIKYLTERYL
jgi:hypothetical protein